MSYTPGWDTTVVLFQMIKEDKVDRYTPKFGASGTVLVGRYQNFDRSLGTVDIKFLE